MTTQEKIQKIREECIKCNPEIVELKFGCKVILKDSCPFVNRLIMGDSHYLGKYGYEMAYEWGDKGKYSSCHENSDDIKEIIGRDIRLADVLYMISEKYKFQSKPQCIAFNGSFYDNGILLATYNLLDDNLEHQSEECIDFIYNLIENK